MNNIDCAKRATNSLTLLMALFLYALIAPAYAQTTTGNATTGKTLYDIKCISCHDSPPTANGTPVEIRNAANAGSVIRRAIEAGMALSIDNNCDGAGDNALCDTELNHIAAYIAQNTTTSTSVDVNFNSAGKQIPLPHIYLDSAYGHFTRIVTTDAPNKGSVSYSGKVATYVPSTGKCGSDSFQWQASGDPNLNPSESSFRSNVRTVNIDIANPVVPTITSGNKTWTFGVFSSYNITTSGGTPLSYDAFNLPPGLSINTSTGVISGSPDAANNETPYSVGITATNCMDNGTQNGAKIVSFTVQRASQVITFATPPAQPFRPSTTYTLVATNSAPLTISFMAGPSNICTNSGSTLTKVGVGSCSVTASRVGTSNYDAATSVTRSFMITNAAQNITFNPQNPPSQGFLLNGTFPINPVATSDSAATPIVYSSLTGAVCNVTGTTVQMLGSGPCNIAANQAAVPNYAAATQQTESVTISAGAPGAPTIGTAYAGNARITLTFTPPANAGSPITSYTASCNTGISLPVTASYETSPIVITGLNNNFLYTCRVTATNAIGTSSPSNASNSVTPTIANVFPSFRSASSATFVVGTADSFRVVASGIPDPTLTRATLPALPSGIAFSTGGRQLDSTAMISGTAALGTVGSYTFDMTASNSSGGRLQTFTLNIIRANQTISFTDPADVPFGVPPVPLVVSASSGLAVALTTTTPGVCNISGNTAIVLAAGTCTINANHAGSANYNAAQQVTQSFDVTPAAQTITFGAQASRTYSPGLMFTLSPLATASSNLGVVYASQTPAVCNNSGANITVLSAGTCNIEASQDGSGNYQGAQDVVQPITINKAPQIVTFDVQAPQPFVPDGTFTINPLATGGASGNPVTYTSTTAAICSVSGSTVTIITPGNCNISANQVGDINYLPAATTSRTVVINAVAPSAPSIEVVTASDAQAKITFLPPTSDGGAPITLYEARCNPGNITASGATSPLLVTGLTNNTPYLCSVRASNGAGPGPFSTELAAAPILATGAALWTAACSGCHGALPAGTRFNAAGTTSTVLQYVRANVPEMLAQSAVQALTANELAEIAKYIQQQIPAISVDTAYQTPKLIDIGFPVDLTLNSVSFTSVEAVTQPTNGVLSAFTGTTATYTPNAGFAGTDTFTYRGKRTSPTNLLGDPRTVTVNVLVPNAPVVTSLATANGVFGQLFNYLITATNSPASFGASNLPSGVTVAPGTGVISGSPTAAGVFNATITATNPGGTSAPAPLTITISAASQSITFGAQASQPFSPGGTFAINPTATASSGLIATYSSLTTNVCTVNVTTVTMLTAGTCTLAANQAGNANVNAALQVTQDIAITATAPGAPNIGAATPGDLQATIAFTPPANNGGSAITSYNATCSPSGTGSNSVSPITVSGLTNGTLYTCSVTATSAAGTSVASGTVMVTPNSTPVAPAITSAAATTFTVLAPSTFAVTVTGTPTPTRSITGSLPPGVTFTPATGLLAGTPASGSVNSYPLTLIATDPSMVNPPANQSFTLTIAKANQTITFANPGARNFSTTPFPITATSTSGISVIFTSNTTSVCTVVGTSVTMLTTGVCSISADVASTADFNAANTVTQGFSIAPAGQSISFGAQTTPRNFSTSPFAITPLATASSGLAVIYTSTTPGVCSVSGTNVSLITAGTCTIAANQGGNANFSAASQTTQSITITAVAPGAPTIGIGTGSDMQVNVGFTPPQSNGGNPISQYNATCTPSGTGSGSASPVAVTGLTNGTTYTCSVTATNTAALTSPASGTVTVTPTSANGAALWLAVCDVCHTQVPAGNQLNGAGSTATVLNYVRATQALMINNSAVQALTQAELAALAAYIGNVVPVNEVTTAFNTAVPINVSSHITLNTISFTSVDVVTPPTNGTLSAFTATSVTYTPNPGFVGVDSFTYQGKRTGPSLIGDPRTVTVTVVGQMPVISSTLTLTGTFGQAVNYQIVASGTPTSFGASDLPASLNIDTGTGAITGIASVVGNFNSTLAATNGNGTGNATLNIIIAKAAQTITFGAQTSPRAFSVGGSFAIAPLATGGASGNSLAYSSTTPGVCTLSGTTVNIVSAGLCTLAANQDGNGDYNSATQVTQNVTITPIAPAPPALDDATAGNAQATINFTPPSNNGGSAITNYTATCGAISANGPTSPITVTGLTNGATVTCTVTATGPGGTSAVSNGVLVTPVSITTPGAPTIGTAIPGNTQVTIAFTPPASNGGSTIINYTATCNPGNVTGSNGASPITVSSLVNGTSYTCSVTATNSIGEGAASATVNVTPGTALALVGVVSRKTHGATGNFDLVVNPALAINDAITTEPRTIGAGHTLVFQFSGPVTVTGSVAAVDSSALSVGTVSAVAAGNDVMVTLTGVPDNKRVTVLLTNVNAVGLDASASVGFLVGDVNGTGSVNSSDISGVKARSGQTTTAVNFKFDVNATGAINASDISAVKARSGLVLAP